MPTEKTIIDACKNGARIREVAIHFRISKSTVGRILRRARAGGDEVVLKKGRPQIARQTYVFHTKRAKRVVSDEEVDRVFAVLSSQQFPYPQHISSDLKDRELSRLRSLCLWVENDVIEPRNSTGSKICTPFFPNRYKARSNGQISAFEAWTTEQMLKKAIRFQLSYGDPVTPKRVLRAITLMCRTPNIFRASVARFVYENYCPKGGLVWDPCAGYGGRLLGSFVAGVRYIGTDVDSETIEGNKRLGEALGANHEIFMVPAERFEAPPVDLIFTSPPYFNREKYSDSDEQSWKYRTFESWTSQFLEPLIRRSKTSLASGKFLVLNIANIKDDWYTIPLVTKTIEIAILAGFSHVKTLQIPLASINRKSPTEPLLVFAS